MLKVFTYYDESIREYFQRSLKSLAFALSNIPIELIIFSDYTIPSNDEKLLRKHFNSIKLKPINAHTRSDIDTPIRVVDQVFMKVLLNECDEDRIFFDPTLFLVNEISVGIEESVFFRQHTGHLSTKFCFLKGGSQFKTAFSAIRRASALRITDIEFTYAIHQNFLIKKKLSNKQIIKGEIFDSSNIINLPMDYIIAIDMENIRMRAGQKTFNLMSSIEKSRGPIVLTKIGKINKTSNKDRSSISDTTTSTTTEDPKRYPFTILLTAYQTSPYIEECLDSIEAQNYFENNDDYEIIIGVDGCHATLAKLEDIKHKYRNLSIYMMSENSGTYITTNTLLSIATKPNIIRFDSDDIMRPHLIKTVAANIHTFDILRLGYSNFIHDTGKFLEKTSIAHGVIYIKKEIVDSLLGGYMPWKCAADSELIFRAKSYVSIKDITDPVFYRRIHTNSLTRRTDIGLESDIRRHYRSMIKSKYNINELYVNRVTANYTKIL